MSHTLYATFDSPADAERAAGALLDRGARAEDLSVVRKHQEGFTPVTAPRTTASDVIVDPTTDNVVETVPGTAESAYDDEDDSIVEPDTVAVLKSGAVQGSMIGAGVGAVALLAALIIPGVGLVIGAGALASGLAGIVAAAGTGAAAGALVRYLKEIGVEDEVAGEYGDAVEKGGAVLAVTVPSGELDEAAAESILEANYATNVNRYAAHHNAA